MLDEYAFGDRKWQEVVENSLVSEPECQRGFTGSFYRLFFTDYKLWNCRIFPARWLSGCFQRAASLPTEDVGTKNLGKPWGSRPWRLLNGPALRESALLGRVGGLACTVSIVCRVAASTNMADGDMRLPTMCWSVQTWTLKLRTLLHTYFYSIYIFFCICRTCKELLRMLSVLFNWACAFVKLLFIWRTRWI